METDGFFKSLLQFMGPALEASLDPIAVLDKDCRLIMASASMRTLLGLRARNLEKKPIFCDLIKLEVCKEKCVLQHAIKTGAAQSFAEMPAAIGTGKMRVLLKAVPFSNVFDEKPTGDCMGVIVTIRDTSPDLLLQAKYQKLKAQADSQ